MKLPNHEYAFIDIDKLRAYVLNPAHPEGRHKARVFLAALGISATDAAWLADEIRSQLSTCEAVPGVADEYGTRFQVDVALGRESRVAQVRTAWIIRNAESFPRLVTCFVL